MKNATTRQEIALLALGDSTVMVRDRINFLRYPHTKDLAWAVGKACEKAWKHASGFQPQKRNATKSAGHGSHQFAHYPPQFVPVIDAFVHQCAADLGLKPAAGEAPKVRVQLTFEW